MAGREQHRIDSERGVIVCDTRHLPFVVERRRSELVFSPRR
jgi:hypothetical protein